MTVHAGDSLRLARHVVETAYDDLPTEATVAARRSLLDALGVMLAAGTLERACRPFVDLAVCRGGVSESTVLGFGVRVPAAAAAFANGAMAHALDFEDAHDRARVHPYAATVAAALAVAEALPDARDRDLVAALVLGSDLVCRLGLALTDDPVKNGWYMAPILGAFGATAAAGRLLGLSAPELVNAFSLTLSQVTGTAESTYGPLSVVRAVRDSFAAQAGVTSAQLAARGVVGFERPFEGKAGLFQLYAPGDHDLEALVSGLGVVFEGANVSYKPWPCCRGTHGHIQAAIGLVTGQDIRPVDIGGLRLGAPGAHVMRLLCEPLKNKRRPLTAIDAKFSLPFTTAWAAVHRSVPLEAFTTVGLEDPHVRRVLDTVECTTEEAGSVGAGWVEIRTRKGSFRADVPCEVYGSPADPLSRDDLLAKFGQCAGHSHAPIPPEHLREVIGHAEDPGGHGRVSDWLPLLGGSAPSRKEI